MASNLEQGPFASWQPEALCRLLYIFHWINNLTIAFFFSINPHLLTSPTIYSHLLVSKHLHSCWPSTHIFPARPISIFCPRRITDSWLTAFQNTSNTILWWWKARGINKSSSLLLPVWLMPWFGKLLQVTLALDFAVLLDCDAVSNLLTSIIILRSFLMFLQTSPACQSPVIEMIISLGKYFPDGFDLCGLCPLLVTGRRK